MVCCGGRCNRCRHDDHPLCRLLASLGRGMIVPVGSFLLGMSILALGFFLITLAQSDSAQNLRVKEAICQCVNARVEGYQCTEARKKHSNFCFKCSLTLSATALTGEVLTEAIEFKGINKQEPVPQGCGSGDSGTCAGSPDGGFQCWFDPEKGELFLDDPENKGGGIATAVGVLSLVTGGLLVIGSACCCRACLCPGWAYDREANDPPSVGFSNVLDPEAPPSAHRPIKRGDLPTPKMTPQSRGQPVEITELTNVSDDEGPASSIKPTPPKQLFTPARPIKLPDPVSLSKMQLDIVASPAPQSVASPAPNSALTVSGTNTPGSFPPGTPNEEGWVPKLVLESPMTGSSAMPLSPEIEGNTLGAGEDEGQIMSVAEDPDLVSKHARGELVAL